METAYIIRNGVIIGADGFSPVVTVTDIEGGHNVAIEDKNGVKNFEVLDGKDAEQRIYTTLAELGLTAPVTVGDIFNAMKDKTIAMIACEDITDHITDVPMSHGVLTIKKGGIGRFSIDYQNSLFGSPCNVKRWIGTLKGSDGTGLTWKQLSAEPTFVTLSDIGLTADATFQDVIDALPKGASALLGVKEFTNYQTIFPYEEGNDQFARVHIVKGVADGSSMYARWFRKDGAKEAIAIFNINDNKFAGWQELATMDKVNASLGELCNKKIYCGEAWGTIVNGFLSVANPIGKAGNVIATMKYLSKNNPVGYSITTQVTLSTVNFYLRWHRESDGVEAYPPDGTEIAISYMIFY